MSTKSHPKNVHEMSPKKRTSCGQKCPRNVTKSVHEMLPLLSTRCHLLCPRNVCHPSRQIFGTFLEKNIKIWILIKPFNKNWSPCPIFFTEFIFQKDLTNFQYWKMTLSIKILRCSRRLFIILVSLMMAWFSEKILISTWCIHGFMLNLIKNLLQYLLFTIFENGRND